MQRLNFSNKLFFFLFVTQSLANYQHSKFLFQVEKIEQKEVERGNGLHDVASILQRRVAVEFSDSDSDSESEYDSEGWGENETSA